VFSHAAAIWTRHGPPSHPTLHCVSGARERGVKSAIAHRNVRLAGEGGVHSNPTASATSSVPADTHPGVWRVVSPTSPMDAVPRGNSLTVVVAGGNHTANYRGCENWNVANAALTKQEAERSRKGVPTGRPVARKAQRADNSAEQMDLCEGWNHVARWVRVVQAKMTPPTNLIPLFSRSWGYPRSL